MDSLNVNFKRDIFVSDGEIWWTWVFGIHWVYINSYDKGQSVSDY